MADYKELLRRAVEALPENNGAARRAVYEKARAALVGQLRAINPPLPARDITTHRLQLEDCIRQVEQEASEANIAGLGAASAEPAAPPTLPPVFASEAKSKPKAAAEPAKAKAEPPKPAAARAHGKANGAAPQGNSIEDIIAAAERDRTPATPPPAAKAPEIKSRPPVLLVHGDRDELIPAQALFQSAQTLAALDVPAEWHLSEGIGHGIDQEGLRHGGEFLARRFGLRR